MTFSKMDFYLNINYQISTVGDGLTEVIKAYFIPLTNPQFN